MLPDTENYDYEDEDEYDFQNKKMPSKTYYMDTKNKVIVGTCDMEDALKQALDKVLNTEFDQYVIYDDYGIELQDLIGMDLDYVQCEIKDRIREAVLNDDRFDSVDNFEFKKSGRKLQVSFVVTAEEEQIESEVEMDV